MLIFGHTHVRESLRVFAQSIYIKHSHIVCHRDNGTSSNHCEYYTSAFARCLAEYWLIYVCVFALPQHFGSAYVWVDLVATHKCVCACVLVFRSMVERGVAVSGTCLPRKFVYPVHLKSNSCGSGVGGGSEQWQAAVRVAVHVTNAHGLASVQTHSYTCELCLTLFQCDDAAHSVGCCAPHARYSISKGVVCVCL